MKEEIFGPILPILAVDNFDTALEYIDSQPHPLSVYVFTKSSDFKARVVENTQSGGVVANDTMTHAAQTTLPFGGVGNSGMGS